MKNSAILFVLALLAVGIWAFRPASSINENLQPALQGSWKLVSVNGTAPQDEVIRIYTSEYFAWGQSKSSDGAFVAAGGGWYKFENGKYIETISFYTPDSTQVGKTFSHDYEQSGNRVKIKSAKGTEEWEQLENGKTALTGTWRMLGRQNSEGKLDSRRPVAARITIKILSGNRFQWAAINTETGEFFGTGGGTYTVENGKYTEHIKFFSRDDSRVGMSLVFDYKVDGEDWYHNGLTSTGGPMAEVWGLYNK
jgi:hypothetical protein